MQRAINCSVDLRSTTAVGDRRYKGMRKHFCRPVQKDGWCRPVYQGRRLMSTTRLGSRRTGPSIPEGT
jgi:hypothetical protein